MNLFVEKSIIKLIFLVEMSLIVLEKSSSFVGVRSIFKIDNFD